MKHVTSGIPPAAIEMPARGHKAQGSPHRDRIVDCFFKGDHVGQRVYNPLGILVLETAMKDGLKHGREITWSDEGKLLLIEPYAEGKIHGTAKQYGPNGKVIGTYTLVRGTGFDVWRQEEEDGTVFVSEIHGLQDGLPNSYEWWFASSKRDLWRESHWKMGKLHGIERVWNGKGRLRRGYPKYYIADQAVSKQKYVRMTLTDNTLPTFREQDNSPYRELPSEIERIMLS